MAPGFKPSTFRCKLGSRCFVHYRTRALYTWSFFLALWARFTHVLASYRQLYCHGELVGLEDVSRITFENALDNFRPVCDSKQVSLRFTLFRVFPFASLDTWS